MQQSVPDGRSLSSLFEPRSVAVVGASSDPAKWGHLAAEKLIRGNGTRPVYLVNKHGAEILGQTSYRSVAELPEAPELSVIAVPQRGFAGSVREVLDRGTKAIVGITAGFGETGEEGAQLQRDIVADVRAAGAVLLGPNCMGVFDAPARLHCLPWAEPPTGHVGIISQSGSLIMDVAKRASEYGLGLSRAASVGNQADVTLAELVRSYAEHDATRVIVLYCEDVGDGRELFSAIEAAVSADVPVVFLAPTADPASVRAARSHTGALLSDDRLIETACRSTGAVLVRSIREATEMTHAVLTPWRAASRGTAIVSDAGGFTVLGASEATRAGLEIPAFGDRLQEQLRGLMLPGAGVGNPVDVVGLLNVEQFVDVLEVILASDEVSNILANVSAFNHDTPDQEREMGHRLAAAAARAEKPIAVVTPDADSPGVAALREHGVPVFADIEAAVAALQTLSEPARRSGMPTLPPRARLGGNPETYFGARELLARHGLTFPEAHAAATYEEALEAAERVGWPVALKALGRLHKSDAGGVALGLRTAAELRERLGDMKRRLDPTSFSVEKMVELEDSIELLLGARNDARFGPVVMIGLGGVFVELLDDTVCALAPIDETVAGELLGHLEGAALFGGARGRESADVAAVARAIAAVSRLAATHREIAELDVNPLVVSPAGAIALDARVILGP